MRQSSPAPVPADRPVGALLTVLLALLGLLHLSSCGFNLRPGRPREFLRRHPNLDEEETKVVGVEILLTAVLDGDPALVAATRREFGLHQHTTPPLRNIYWIAGYPRLIELTTTLPVD